MYWFMVYNLMKMTMYFLVTNICVVFKVGLLKQLLSLWRKTRWAKRGGASEVGGKLTFDCIPIFLTVP